MQLRVKLIKAAQENREKKNRYSKNVRFSQIIVNQKAI
jgi:hypothetical protein